MSLPSVSGSAQERASDSTTAGQSQGPRHIGGLINEAMLDIARKAVWNPDNNREIRRQVLRYLREHGEAAL